MVLNGFQVVVDVFFLCFAFPWPCNLHSFGHITHTHFRNRVQSIIIFSISFHSLHSVGIMLSFFVILLYCFWCDICMLKWMMPFHSLFCTRTQWAFMHRDCGKWIGWIVGFWPSVMIAGSTLFTKNYKTMTIMKIE